MKTITAYTKGFSYYGRTKALPNVMPINSIQHLLTVLYDQKKCQDHWNPIVYSDFVQAASAARHSPLLCFIMNSC